MQSSKCYIRHLLPVEILSKSRQFTCATFLSFLQNYSLNLLVLFFSFSFSHCLQIPKRKKLKEETLIWAEGFRGIVHPCVALLFLDLCWGGHGSYLLNRIQEAERSIRRGLEQERRCTTSDLLSQSICPVLGIRHKWLGPTKTLIVLTPPNSPFTFWSHTWMN